MESATTVDKFDEPNSAWALIDGLEAIMCSYSWTGDRTDAFTDAVLAPFILFVRQRQVGHGHDSVRGVRMGDVHACVGRFGIRVSGR